MKGNPISEANQDQPDQEPGPAESSAPSQPRSDTEYTPSIPNEETEINPQIPAPENIQFPSLWMI